MPEHDVTAGELYRLIQSMDKKLDTMHMDMVGRKEYEADQEGVNRRFEESGKVHTDLKAEVAAVDTKHDARHAALEQKIEAGEKMQRETRSKWTLSLVGSGVTFVLSIIAAILIRVTS